MTAGQVSSPVPAGNKDKSFGKEDQGGNLKPLKRGKTKAGLWPDGKNQQGSCSFPSQEGLTVPFPILAPTHPVLYLTFHSGSANTIPSLAPEGKRKDKTEPPRSQSRVLHLIYPTTGGKLGSSPGAPQGASPPDPSRVKRTDAAQAIGTAPAARPRSPSLPTRTQVTGYPGDGPTLT